MASSAERLTTRSFTTGKAAARMTEAIRLALEDARLRKEDIDGLMCNAQTIDPIAIAEYAQMRVSYSLGVSNWGASGATSIAMAAAAIDGGLANTIVCVFGGSRDFQGGGGGAGASGAEEAV